MLNRSLAAAVAAFALPCLALPVTALAQTAPPPMTAQTAPPPATAQTAPPPAMAQPAAAHARAPMSMADVERHIVQLHNQLKITPAEQPQWEQFAQVMRDNAGQMGTVFSDRAADIGNMSAADDMQSYAQLAQVHAANMQKLSTAFKALYDSFPAAQKQVADQVFKAQARRRG